MPELVPSTLSCPGIFGSEEFLPGLTELDLGDIFSRLQ